MKKNAGNEEELGFAPQKINMTFPPKTLNMKKIKKREPRAILISKPSELNLKHNLPMKHFFQ